MTLVPDRKRSAPESPKEKKKLSFRLSQKYFYGGLISIVIVFSLLSYTRLISSDATEFVTDTLILIGIYALLSISLDLEFGFTGLVNFGKSGFYLIGAYSAAIFVAYYRDAFAWTGNAVVGAFIFGILVGMAISAGVGAVLSAIGARLREDYFGILTLVFAEIIRRAIYDTSETPPFQGAFGINGFPTIMPSSIYTNPLVYSVVFLFIIAGAFCVAYFFVWRIINSPFGRSIRAVRDDELASQSIGKNTLWYKMQVMMIGSAIAAVPGAIFAEYLQSVNPSLFLPAITFQVWIIAIMGGSSNLKGALLGGGIYYVIARFADLSKNSFGFSTTQAINIQYIITGVLLILFVILRPQGIIKEEKIKAGKLEV